MPKSIEPSEQLFSKSGPKTADMAIFDCLEDLDLAWQFEFKEFKTFKASTAADRVRNWAKERGLGVRVKMVDGGFIAQAFELTPEQKALRAARAQNLARARAARKLAEQE